jgi:hypothetical protein
MESMNVLRRGACVALYALSAACGGSSVAPPSSAQPPATDGTITITGGERLAWTEAEDGADAFVYAAYVDGVRNDLQAVCTASSPSVYACQSPLPSMAKGTHTLQLSAAIREGDTLVEGPRSVPIVVDVTTSGASRVVTGPPPELRAASASVESAPDTTAPSSCGLTTSDATHVIAWTGVGELQLIDTTSRAAQPLIWSTELDATWRIGAVASRFEGTSRIVYSALTSVTGSDRRLRVLRYRELNGVLGERAVLVEGDLPDEPARVTASFGPDGRVSVAFAWTSSSDAPRPFVVAVDPGTSAPLDFDGRFTAQTPVVAAWDRDGRFWIVERAGGGYTIRTAGAAAAPVAAPAGFAGIEPLTSVQAAPIALFSTDGSGWLASAADSGAVGQLVRRQFLHMSDSPFDAISLSGAAVVVACSLGTRLTLTYGIAP